MAKRSPYTRIRVFDDTTLSNALGNHTAVLQQVVGWIRAFGREHVYVRVWGLTVTGAVIWLALR